MIINRTVIVVLVIIIGLFTLLLYGGWSIMKLILALVILNLGWTISIQKQLSTHLGEHKGYRNGRFNSQH